MLAMLDKIYGRFFFLTLLAAASALVFCPTSSWALQPPGPGEIEQLQSARQFKPLLNNALRLGNHKIDPILLSKAINKGKRAILTQQGIDREIIDKLAPVYAPPPRWQGMPTTGDVKILALLIEFQDYTHATYNSESYIQESLFGTGDSSRAPYESLSAYYDRASYSQLDLSSGDTLGWYKTAYDRPVDTGDANAWKVPADLIKEVIKHYDSSGHDFSQYDNNNDGVIDYFIVIWTGPSGPWASLWWGWQYDFSYLDPSFTVDGKQLGKFSWQWESNPMGSRFHPLVAIHETGHALGLPDLYDYQPGYGPEGGVGKLDMMDGNKGDHNCFSKWVLDWLNPTFVSSGTHRLQLQPSGVAKDCVVEWPGIDTGDLFSEFFVAQNRHRIGNDDAPGIPGDGMLLWHIDATLNASGRDYLYNNSTSDHKLVKLLEADGLEEIESGSMADSDDYWDVGHYFGQHTTPSSAKYDGSDSHVLAYDFSTSGVDMSGTFEISAESAGGWSDDGPVVRLTTNSDNVGIGTVNPIDKLEVEGGQITVDGAGQLGALRFRQNNTMKWTLLTAPWIGENDLRIRNEARGNDIISFDGQTNNVGIGTNAPGRKLSIVSPSYQIRLNGTGPNGIEFMDRNGQGGMNVLYRTAPDELRIENENGTPYFSIERDSHEIHIGEGSLIRYDLKNLHKKQPNLAGTNLVIGWNYSGGRGETDFYQHGGSGWRSGYDFWTERTGVGKRLQARIEDTGDLNIRGGFGSLSDLREKTDIKPISDALDKVMKLRGVSFYWKDRESHDNKQHLGLIAQEVQNVIPEVVKGGTNVMGEEEKYSLYYDGLIPVLLQAIKEQQQTIGQLSDRLSKLEAIVKSKETE